MTTISMSNNDNITEKDIYWMIVSTLINFNLERGDTFLAK